MTYMTIDEEARLLPRFARPGPTIACDCCGDRVDVDDLAGFGAVAERLRDQHGPAICDHCEAFSLICDECGDAFHEDDVTDAPHGGWVCRKCEGYDNADDAADLRRDGVL